MSVQISLPIADLLIDEQNPRLTTPNRGQRETIREMANLQGSRLQVLATDIQKNGLDPSELFIVMPGDSSGYLVLDGNRRVTALKVLENPEIIKGAVPSAVFNALEALKKEYNPSTNDPVSCILVNDRTEADHWIELKHTGYQDGAGPLRWGPDEGARFRGRTGGALDAETQALNFLQERGDIDLEFRRKVPTTTFRRLLRTPAVREKLGLDWKDQTLLITGAEDAVAKSLLHVAKDLSTGRITVRNLDRQADRIRYAESLPPEIVVEKQREQNGKQADKKKSSQRRSSGTRQRIRDQLIPDDATLNITNDRIRDIEGELRNLSLQRFPNAVSVLIRVFLELSADAYLEKSSLPHVTESSYLGTKLHEITSDLESKNKLNAQQAKVVRRAAQRDNYIGVSVTGMNQYIHNLHLYPSAQDLIADWNNLQPWFEAVWE